MLRLCSLPGLDGFADKIEKAGDYSLWADKGVLRRSASSRNSDLLFSVVSEDMKPKTCIYFISS